MIRYALLCVQQHEFDGWFPSSAGFEAQAASGEVRCPVCGSAEVRKALMAPGLGRGTKRGAKRSEISAAPEPAQKMNMMMLALRKHVEENCDYVGDKFAEEARRIHFGEADPRGIHGEATAEEARSLADDGVEFMPIPVFPDDRN